MDASAGPGRGPLHLLKLAVGIDDPAHLRAVQGRRVEQVAGIGVCVALFTRQMPRRAAELLDDGSLFWVIRGAVCARQRLVAIDPATDGDGRACCRLRLDPQVTETCVQTHRPFQGWRYLDPRHAPPDRAEGGDAALPESLVRELRGLGLL